MAGPVCQGGGGPRSRRYAPLLVASAADGRAVAPVIARPRTPPRRRAGEPARFYRERAGLPLSVRQLQPEVGEGAGVAGDAVDVDRMVG